MEKKELIDMILQTPTDRQVRIINDYFYGDKLLKEIGEDIGLAECTVSTLLKRGLESCRGVAQGMKGLK